MHEVGPFGNPDKTPNPSIGDTVAGMAKGLYQVSTPGIAASIAQKVAPEMAEKIPSVLHGAPLESIPAKSAMQFLRPRLGE